MPTERQIQSEVKKQETEKRRSILDRVISAALHVIHDSDLSDTSLWPKKGFVAGFRWEFDKSDIIKYSARVEFSNGRPAWQAIYFNTINKSGMKCYRQAKQIDIILDQAIYDGIHFTSEQLADNYFHYSECPFSGLHYTSLIFKFTINN